MITKMHLGVELTQRTQERPGVLLRAPVTNVEVGCGTHMAVGNYRDTTDHDELNPVALKYLQQPRDVEGRRDVLAEHVT